MKTKILFLIVALVMISLSSCKKESVLDQTSIDLADDDAVSNAIFDDIFNTIDYADIMLDALQKGESSKSDLDIMLSDSCPSVTITHPGDNIWPVTITIDYGTGCTGFYESTRSGKIIVIITGPRRETGSQRSVTFEEYYINRIKVEGSYSLETIGFNDNQNFVIAATLTDGKLTLPEGQTIERSFEHQKEWIAGLNTFNIWDDECLVTGTATGININGISYNRTITSALHWKRACRFLVSGVVKIEREGLEPFEIDFGTGECDAVATVTMGDESREITLKLRHRLMGK
jgi:hypothetical protein